MNKRLTLKLDEDLTTKYLDYKYVRIPDYDIEHGNYGRISDDMLYNKLGKLEDIEDKLGIDLETLFKALSYPIYVKEKDETWWCANRLFFAMGEAFIVITFGRKGKEEDITLLLKDYGKTWALKEEELK